MIWKIFPEVEAINNFNNNTLVSHLGIEITEFGPDYVKARMPVDHRTRQPMGLLHGGISSIVRVGRKYGELVDSGRAECQGCGH